jgi:hypothetical protein
VAEAREGVDREAAGPRHHGPPPTLAGGALWLVSTAEGLSWLGVAVGGVFRVCEYAKARSLYLDERFLLQNLTDRPVFDLNTLSEHQIAAPGFLVVERLMVRLLPLTPTPAARLLPLLCGIASLFVLVAVARRYLDRRAVPVATWLFAATDYLLYYASEIKQYSSDVLLTLCALWLAARLTRPPVPGGKRWGILAAFGATAVWFSHPVALVLAGVGTYLIAVPALSRRWAEALTAAAVCACWAVSFGVCFVVSDRLLDRSDTFMMTWWNFAFLPIPPRSGEEAGRLFWHLVNAFVHPAGVITPLGYRASGLIGLALFVVGGISMGRRWPGGLWLITAPAVFTLAASAVHKYPFHGRLILFLIPTVHLLVAEGVAAVGRKAGLVVTVGLALFLVATPVCDAVWQLAIVARARPFDSHGDLWNDLLDQIDFQKERALRRDQAPGPRRTSPSR